MKTAAGDYSPTGSPVYLLTRTSFCKTSAATGDPAAPCATAGDEVVTTYDYGPDSGPSNLQLRGTVTDAGGLNLRSCQSSDAMGNTTSQTGPGAALSSCN